MACDVEEAPKRSLAETAQRVRKKYCIFDIIRGVFLSILGR